MCEQVWEMKKRFLVEYPKIYKISFPARYQFFFTYMCVSQGKNMKWILIAIITLLSRTRLEAASSEEVIDIRALNNLSNVEIGNKILSSKGQLHPKNKANSLAIKIKQNSFYCCTSEIFYVGNVAPLFYWTLFYGNHEMNIEVSTSLSLSLTHSLTLQKSENFWYFLKPSLATHGMTEETKVSQFR